MSEIVIGPVLQLPGTAVIPISVEDRFCALGASLWFHAQRRPAGVVVATGAGVRAFYVDGTEHDPGPWFEAFPELADALR